MEITIKRTYTTTRGQRGITGTIDGRSFARFIRRSESPADAALRIWGVDIAEDLEWGDGLDLCRAEDLTESGEVITEQMRGAKAWLGAITGRCDHWTLRALGPSPRVRSRREQPFALWPREPLVVAVGPRGRSIRGV